MRFNQMAKPGMSTDQPSGELIGYARISTIDQNLDMQIAALRKAGVAEDRLFHETVSGVAKRRPRLEQAMKAARRGDTLVVWKLDRVGRSLLDLLDRLNKLEAAGVGFRSLTEGIDTTTPGGRLIMHVMGSLSQFERDLVVERTRAGVRRHIERGGRIGAERKMTAANIKRVAGMFRRGQSVREAAAAIGVAPMTIYTYFPGGPEKYRH